MTFDAFVKWHSELIHPSWGSSTHSALTRRGSKLKTDTILNEETFEIERDLCAFGPQLGHYVSFTRPCGEVTHPNEGRWQRSRQEACTARIGVMNVPICGNKTFECASYVVI